MQSGSSCWKEQCQLLVMDASGASWKSWPSGHCQGPSRFLRNTALSTRYTWPSEVKALPLLRAICYLAFWRPCQAEHLAWLLSRLGLLVPPPHLSTAPAGSAGLHNRVLPLPSCLAHGHLAIPWGCLSLVWIRHDNVLIKSN